MIADLPPKIWTPAIIQAAAPWEIDAHRQLAEQGVSRNVRRAVIAELKRLEGVRASLIKPSLDDLSRYAGVDANIMPGIGPAAGLFGGKKPLALTFINSFTNTASGSSFDFTVDLGAYSSDLLIIVSTHTSNTAPGPINNSGTIQGQTATVHVTGQNARNTSFMSAHPTAGGSQTVHVGLSGSGTFCSIGVWRATGLNSMTPVDTDTIDGASPASKSLTIDVSGGGFGLFVSGTSGTAGITTTNATEDYDFSPEASQGAAGATWLNTGADTTRTVTMDAVRTLIGASWR